MAVICSQTLESFGRLMLKYYQEELVACSPLKSLPRAGFKTFARTYETSFSNTPRAGSDQTKQASVTYMRLKTSGYKLAAASTRLRNTN